MPVCRLHFSRRHFPQAKKREVAGSSTLAFHVRLPQVHNPLAQFLILFSSAWSLTENYPLVSTAMWVVVPFCLSICGAQLERVGRERIGEGGL